ncbi:universal stress protein [Natronococcus wangiae]
MDETVGKAAQTIVRYTEENDVIDVVLGSHGRCELSRFLLGNVAERVA